jgi:hypothetical protein
MARQYALPEDTRRSNRDDPRGLSGYIKETARKYGVDPDVALKVAKSEGLRDFSGDGGKSGGAFQLYTGGGLGNEFQKQTGLDPLDPKNEKATIDYALKHASQHGWKPWHGAAKVGVGEYDGISGGAQATSTGASTATAGDTAPSDTSATQVKGTNISTTTPDTGVDTSPAATGASTSDFIAKLQDPKGNASAGLGETISGLGQAFAGTGMAGKNLYPSVAATVPVAPTAPPPNLVPMVNPRAADAQRQQLALAMQRLNSGRLV